MGNLADYTLTISSRKFGFTCIFVSQNYTSIISRNRNVIMVLKMIKFQFNGLSIITDEQILK